MVAYSFKPQFIEPIRAGIKTQTLRNPRARHARPGETIQLYTGMRTKACRLIGTATCVVSDIILVDFEHARVEWPDRDQGLFMDRELDTFARIDGFADWPALVAFWRKTHPGVSQWEGVQIAWDDTFMEPTP